MVGSTDIGVRLLAEVSDSVAPLVIGVGRLFQVNVDARVHRIAICRVEKIPKNKFLGDLLLRSGFVLRYIDVRMSMLRHGKSKCPAYM